MSILPRMFQIYCMPISQDGSGLQQLRAQEELAETREGKETNMGKTTSLD